MAVIGLPILAIGFGILDIVHCSKQADELRVCTV